jgi:hypothetical protein
MSDLTDDRPGAYDPVTKYGLRQPPQVKDTTTPHQKARCGCETLRPYRVRTHVPERLVRPAAGPLHPRTGRKPTD